MKNLQKNWKLLFMLCIACISCNKSEKRPVDYVDPFICTQGDHGHWLPAALVPFGLVELCPDTWPGSLIADGDFAHSGYDYSDSQIRGFSHMHRGSSGGGSIHDRAGLISLVPFTDALSDTFFVNPILDIDKKTETASAGFYKVHLTQQNIMAELTATTRNGFHRYTFQEGEPVHLFLNSGKRGQAISCTLVSPLRLEGAVGNRYFVAEFDAPVLETSVWNGNQLEPGDSTGTQAGAGLVCSFGELKNKTLQVKVGLSLTGIEAATKNLEAECPGWDFEKTRQKAEKAWNDILSGIEVSGENDEDKTIFYTALYHTCFLPQIINDVDGKYPGLDKNIHQADGYNFYNNYAFWDSFRTKYPLYSLWIPAVYRDITKSLRDIYGQAGSWDPFPDNDHPPHGFCYTVRGKDGYQPFSTCRHEHMLMVVADAYVKGLFDFPLESVYPYMKHEAMIQMPEKYDSIGFIPARPDQTGEYSWDNWVMAQMAKELGYDDDYAYFMKRSEYWRNTWDPSIKYFRARAADGTWLDFPDDPTENREKYTYEGSKWHWRWNIIHDIASLMGYFGGKEAFLKELEYFFDNDLYTAGNQIDLHAPYLFNMAGAPWLTQKWVRKILTEPIVQKYGTHNFFPEPIFDRVYKATPDGYLEEMDCDYGCMAAWYNMSAMGLYQVCPGDPVYQLTAPIFEEVKIRLDEKIYPGKLFVIKAKNLSKENSYIQSATLNGNVLNRSWISHDEIANGGEMVFEMGSQPNKNWGIDSIRKQ
ncbi:GH92 family glycosyl hydrolase [Gaoshiqia sp. Z1-71]|uniref:GH92 family glycosyl hydrolase n=1 Tax=Gaoshiqia hydrogeniformans TaxID=3290090 RepID=UPI003BF7F891